MKPIQLNCASCGKKVLRSRGRVNEAKKFGWSTYCSSLCLAQKLKKQKSFKCSNPGCGKTFWRRIKESEAVKRTYCSRSCSITVNNSKKPKRKKKLIKNKCAFCKKTFFVKGKYCSVKCKHKDQTINKKDIIRQIKQFYKKHNRIPLKKEFKHVRAARHRFGSWNKAIQAAGFTPNPVMFAEKHTAKDGHICDSLTEKIIDDWLSDHKIKHKCNVPYPCESQLTCDFVVDDYFIEFFGLDNQHKKYTKLVRKKRKIAKQYNINLIEVKPKDVFPSNKLNKRLRFLLK